MVLKQTESSPGIADMDNLKESYVKKRLPYGKISPYPVLTELVSKDYYYPGKEKDRIPPPIPLVVYFLHPLSVELYNLNIKSLGEVPPAVPGLSVDHSYHISHNFLPQTYVEHAQF